MSADILRNLADTHPDPVVANILRQRADEEAAEEAARGETAIALLKELQRTVTHSHPSTKAEWIAYAESLEEIIGDFDN